MPTLIMERQGKSQIGSTTGTAGYVQGGGDINFATGQAAHIRMKSLIPRGATVTSARLRFMMVAKSASTAQTCYNSIRAHASGDAPPLTIGVAEGTRPWTTARVEWTVVWPVNPTGDVFMWVEVKSVVQEIVNRSDYQPGGFISFMVYTDNENGSDMGFRANNDFAPTVQLHADWVVNDDWQYDINLHGNPNLDALPAIDATALPFWNQGTFYGTFVDPANEGVIARDTSFTRLPGVPTMRFTTGTPPTENTKRTGPYTVVAMQSDVPYIFCGWTYIPSAITTDVYFGDPYIGKSHKIILRDQWVPFCTYPSNTSTPMTYGAFWPAVHILPPFQAGWQFWVSEPTILHSSFRKMPFNGRTPDVVDPGGSILVDHRMTGNQTATRQWLPRTGVVRQGTLRRVPRYTQRSDGILVNAEPVKGGPLVPNMPAVAISTYPAGKTISEL